MNEWKEGLIHEMERYRKFVSVAVSGQGSMSLEKRDGFLWGLKKAIEIVKEFGDPKEEHKEESVINDEKVKELIMILEKEINDAQRKITHSAPEYFRSDMGGYVRGLDFSLGKIKQLFKE